MAPPDNPPARLLQRVATYGICEDDNGRVLLTRAAPWLSIAGQWFLPGGDVAPTPAGALSEALGVLLGRPGGRSRRHLGHDGATEAGLVLVERGASSRSLGLVVGEHRRPVL